jgi:hypothetical protein
VIGVIDITLWRSSSPFVTEGYVYFYSVVLTGVVVAVSIFVLVLRLDSFIWPTVWSAIGALVGTFQTVVSFSGTGGFHIIDGKAIHVGEVLQEPIQGPLFALLGAIVCPVLYIAIRKLLETRQIRMQSR